MNSKKNGYISISVMTILVGGIALGGLLVYQAQTGQDLPLWPALAVALVNLVAAAKIVYDVRKRKQQPPPSPPNNNARPARKRR